MFDASGDEPALDIALMVVDLLFDGRTLPAGVDSVHHAHAEAAPVCGDGVCHPAEARPYHDPYHASEKYCYMDCEHPGSGFCYVGGGLRSSKLFEDRLVEFDHQHADWSVRRPRHLRDGCLCGSGSRSVVPLTQLNSAHRFEHVFSSLLHAVLQRSLQH